MRRIGGYFAAIAVTPYLLIKISWTFGLFLPTEQMREASWRTINAATVALAAVAILLAMAFCWPWGERLPAWLVALPVWVGTGLLVPMVFLAPVLGRAAIARDKDAGAADVWAYEQILVMVSLVGVGIGLSLGLAGYAKARWPEALGGPLEDGEPPGHTRQLQITWPGSPRPAASSSASSRSSGPSVAPSASTRPRPMNATSGGIYSRSVPAPGPSRGRGVCVY
jgi:hypothetical protein